MILITYLEIQEGDLYKPREHLEIQEGDLELASNFLNSLGEDLMENDVLDFL